MNVDTKVRDALHDGTVEAETREGKASDKVKTEPSQAVRTSRRLSTYRSDEEAVHPDQASKYGGSPDEVRGYDHPSATGADQAVRPPLAR